MKPYNKLKAYFVEHGIKQIDVAKVLGITNSSFNKKINRNGEDFTINQVKTLCEHYNLDANIFFK